MAKLTWGVRRETGPIGKIRFRLVLGAVALVALAGCSSAPTSRTSDSRPSAPAKSPTTTTTTTTTGVAPTTTSTTAPPPSPSALRYGPGPQTAYVVEPQPPAGSCHYTLVGSDPLPDPHCTPGALNPQVTQASIGSTICRSGYSSSIRPPEAITEAEKRGSASAYDYTGPFSTGEYDHLVPLELGGDPNDPANLWVEPNDDPNATTTANSKDVLEDRLHSLVCAGQLPLTTAQDAIASNWVTAYHQYVGAPPPPAPSAAAVTSGSAAPPNGTASCAASAMPANDGYSGDDYVSVTSNQPDEKATASDARDSWSHDTDSSGNARILLYDASSGAQINVTVGAASCSTVAP